MKLVAPNAKLDNGFECQNEDTTLNAKLKRMMALNAQLWRHGGSKRPKLEEMSGSEHLKLMKGMTLNA